MPRCLIYRLESIELINMKYLMSNLILMTLIKKIIFNNATSLEGDIDIVLTDNLLIFKNMPLHIFT